MSKSTTVITQKKKRGPKPTGKGTLIGVRLQPELLATVDKWGEDNNTPSRPEAIRQLVEKALKD
ncbi:MAG: hypothetical protein COA78_15095 [Blastopirellula sp.]|nr:MAG: hypothetical protein COA78_15095 [Blastopirellula sp.]